MYSVYVIYSIEHQKSYVGISNDVASRLSAHNSGYSKYTSKFVPWVLLHTEAFDTRLEARAREKYLKSGAGRRWMKKHIDWPRSSAE